MSMILAVALMFSADKAEPEPKPPAPPKADIRGELKVVGIVNAKGIIARLGVIGKKEKDTMHDKASVLVLATTKLYAWKRGKKVEAKFADLVAGCVVQCVFDGPVAETDPVQARAAEVLILSFPKKK